MSSREGGRGVWVVDGRGLRPARRPLAWSVPLPPPPLPHPVLCPIGAACTRPRHAAQPLVEEACSRFPTPWCVCVWRGGVLPNRRLGCGSRVLSPAVPPPPTSYLGPVLAVGWTGSLLFSPRVRYVRYCCSCSMCAYVGAVPLPGGTSEHPTTQMSCGYSL